MINRRSTEPSGSQVYFEECLACNSTIISGLAARHYDWRDSGTKYDLAPGIEERIRWGAFERAVREQQNVRGLFNHNSDNVLATVASETLALYIEPAGLRYEINVNLADPDHVRVVEKIKRGDLTGSSFAFQPTQVSWEVLKDGTKVRWIEDLNLFDVGPVTFPAYQGTTTGLRQGSEELAELHDEYEEWDAKLQLRLRQLRLAMNEQATFELSYSR